MGPFSPLPFFSPWREKKIGNLSSSFVHFFPTVSLFFSWNSWPLSRERFVAFPPSADLFGVFSSYRRPYFCGPYTHGSGSRWQVFFFPNRDLFCLPRFFFFFKCIRLWPPPHVAVPQFSPQAFRAFLSPVELFFRE